MRRRRRSPRQHEVHPRDQKYKVSVYQRGKNLFTRVSGDTNIDLSLDDPRKAREDIEVLKAEFNSKPIDEQHRIVKSLSYASSKSEQYVNSGIVDNDPDKVDDVLKCRRTYNNAFDDLQKEYLRNRDRMDFERSVE
jgi:hypothetical protein